MRYIFPTKLIGRCRRSCKIILAALWCAGLICGISAAACAGILPSLMRACCQSRVSIVSLLFVPLLPFLFSAFAVFISCPRLVCFVGFLKAFSFGLCLRAVSAAFGSAGWLVCSLLLFTDCVTMPALFWFWLRHADGNISSLGKDSLICTTWFLLIAIIDSAYVTPMLIQIF